MPATSSSIDLNFLLVFEAMFEHRSVSAAAESLGVSQSTMSYNLAKLRRQLDDPLFIRAPGGMQPTPHAVRLAEPVRLALDVVRTQLLRKNRFSAAEARRTFTLCMTETAEATFLPRILAFLRAQARGIRLRTVMMDHRSLETAMIKGDVDLALGYFPDLKGTQFYQQALYPHPNPRAPRRSYVCVVREDHPRVGMRLGMKQFLSEFHVQVKPLGRSHEIVDRLLAQHRLGRHIVLTTPHFTSLPGILAASDLIAVVPESIGRLLAQLQGIRMVALPLSTPNYDPKQYWHARFHEDEENRWLRKTIGQLFPSAERSF